MHQNFTQAKIIDSRPSIIEVEKEANPIIDTLKQKLHVQEDSRFPSPQLLISLHAHTKISLMGYTNAPYVRMRSHEIPMSGLVRLAGLYFI